MASQPLACIQMYTHGDWKLIEFFDTHTIELYNLAGYPDEQGNLSDEHPDKTVIPSALVLSWAPGPIANSRFTENEMAQIAAAPATVAVEEGIETLAPGWAIAQCGPDMSPGLRNETRGRKSVLVTHPLGRDAPCVLSREVEVPAGKKTVLQVTAGHHPDGDWDLVVPPGLRELLKKKVGKATAIDGWLDMHVDLSEYAGKTEGVRYRTLRDRLVLSNIHQPSITAYLPPPEVSTGTAVVVIPGGGFRSNWITHEGYRVAEWFTRRGIAAFVLKYRLERDTGSEYSTIEHSLADAQRAIRTVRSRASEWSIDPERIGVIGFSAGGVLSGLAGTHFDKPVNNRIDTIDDLSARPAFMGLIYGSPFGPSSSRDAKIRKAMPPVFLAAGGDDRIAEAYPEIYKQLRAAGVSAELHIYAGVGHGFGIQHTNFPAVAGWIDRFYEWLFTQGLLYNPS